MTHHLANSLKQDVLHILSALKIYFSLHIWNLSEVHSPSSSSSALQHQCSKQAIHGYRIFFVFQKTITSIIPITFEEWWNKKNLLHHTQVGHNRPLTLPEPTLPFDLPSSEPTYPHRPNLTAFLSPVFC